MEVKHIVMLEIGGGVKGKLVVLAVNGADPVSPGKWLGEYVIKAIKQMES